MKRPTLATRAGGPARELKNGTSDDSILPEVLGEGLENLERITAELDYLRDRFWKADARGLVRTRSPKMRAILDKVRLVAPARTTVMLNGETGVGKSTIARLIHRHSERCDRQFISVHCGAISEELIESELFGHEKGAFTGAVRRRLGKFEVADGGTIFLDEIGLMSLAAQVKLLSVIQERTLQRVGSERDIAVDVRVIAASNVNLAELCEQGGFRRDLFYRLNVFPIEIPPLRQRREDLPLIAGSILDRLQRGQSKQLEGIDPKVLEALGRYQWPGNVRELENLIERAYILEQGPDLSPDSFPAELFDEDSLSSAAPSGKIPTLAEFRQRTIEQLERKYFTALLRRHGGRLHNVADSAGIGLRQLHKLLTRLGLRQELSKAQGGEGGNGPFPDLDPEEPSVP
jgi:DNA-binding NtrC family response regulator